MEAQRGNKNVDKATVVGIVVIGVSVAAFSSYSLFQLAIAAGVPAGLAWVLPVTTDAAGAVTTRVWLMARHTDKIRKYARMIAIFAVVSSTIGAAIQHTSLIGSKTVPGPTGPITFPDPPEWLKMLIGGLPSLMLALLVHLGSMIAMSIVEARQQAQREAEESRLEEQRRIDEAERERVATIEAAKVKATAEAEAIKIKAAAEAEAAAEAARREREALAPKPKPEPVVETEQSTGATVLKLEHHEDQDGRPTWLTDEMADNAKLAMFAYLDRHPDATGAELDRFGMAHLGTKKDYGRGVRRAWLKEQAEEVLRPTGTAGE